MFKVNWPGIEKVVEILTINRRKFSLTSGICHGLSLHFH